MPESSVAAGSLLVRTTTHNVSRLNSGWPSLVIHGHRCTHFTLVGQPTEIGDHLGDV